MKYKQSLLLLAITAYGFGLCAQPRINATNLAHQYNPQSEIGISYKAIAKEDSLTIFLGLKLNQGKPERQDYSFTFYSTGSYGNKLDEIDATKIKNSYNGQDDRIHRFRFKIPASDISSILAIQVQSNFSGLNYLYDFIVRDYPLTLMDRQGNVILDSWISENTYHFNTDGNIFGYYYSHNFPPSLPPMPTKEADTERAMTIDSTFIMRGRSFVPVKQGLYLFQLDSTSNQGLSFRMENKFFPRLAKLENVIEPLIYITTKEENLRLQSIKEDKKAFDRFWLDLTNSPERAKNIIKNYFERVEQANRSFTTYKEGWKTDMGMIYIIFGPPDEVSKTSTGQTWNYLASTQLPKMEFEFIRVENIFSPTQYVLIRDKKYTSPWFKSIDLWRKGRF